MKKYYALHPASYGTTIKYLGKFNNFDEASEKADSILTDLHSAFWITDESDIRAMLASIKNELKKD